MFVVLAVAAALPESGHEPQSWCFNPLYPGNAPVDDTIKVFVPESLPESVKRTLLRQTFVDASSDRSGEHLYYVRGGIVGRMDMNEHDIQERAKLAQYKAHFDRKNGDLVVTSYITENSPKREYNVVLGVRTRHVVKRAYTFCWGPD